MMMRFLFKQSRPKRFDYKPRFYDERKERLNARIEAVRKEQKKSEGKSSPEAMRTRMQDAWRNRSGVHERRRSNKNIFIIAGLLVVVAYLLLYR